MSSDQEPTAQLDFLAGEVRWEIEQSKLHAGSAVAHAIRAGQRLIEAKAQVKHGEWLPWLEANFEGTTKTASNYMRLASNQKCISDLPSVASGLAALAAGASVGKLKAGDELKEPPISDDEALEDVEVVDDRIEAAERRVQEAEVAATKKVKQAQEQVRLAQEKADKREADATARAEKKLRRELSGELAEVRQQLQRVEQERDALEQERIGQALAAKNRETDSPQVNGTTSADALTPELLSESWADGHIQAVDRAARKLSSHVRAWGLVVQSLSLDEALDLTQRSEGAIADVRAALQERIRDEAVS